VRPTAADPLPRRGDGIVLRRLSTADLGAFQAYRGDAELGRYQGWSAMPDEAARAFLAEMSEVALFRPGEWAQIGIALPDGAALIGDIGLHLAEDARHAEIGFTLSRSAQGRGLATAAVREALQLVFECSTAERVLGITDASNFASIALLKRVGMRALETRDAIFRGEACVEVVYALSRDGG
jgi:ribosomal-protein-alanine N-acetyltransferase